MSNVEVTQPTIVNFICPRCRLTWMNQNVEGRYYFCYACNFILFDKQVEILKSNCSAKSKICNFFSHPWVAFPLMVLMIVAFMYFGLKHAR